MPRAIVKLYHGGGWLEEWGRFFYASLGKTFHAPFHSLSRPACVFVFSSWRHSPLNINTHGDAKIPEDRRFLKATAPSSPAPPPLAPSPPTC